MLLVNLRKISFIGPLKLVKLVGYQIEVENRSPHLFLFRVLNIFSHLFIVLTFFFFFSDPAKITQNLKQEGFSDRSILNQD